MFELPGVYNATGSAPKDVEEIVLASLTLHNLLISSSSSSSSEIMTHRLQSITSKKLVNELEERIKNHAISSNQEYQLHRFMHNL